MPRKATKQFLPIQVCRPTIASWLSHIFLTPSSIAAQQSADTASTSHAVVQRLAQVFLQIQGIALLLVGLLSILVTLIIGLLFCYGDYAKRAVKYRTLAAAIAVPALGWWVLSLHPTWQWNPLFYCAAAIFALLISGLNDVRSDFLRGGEAKKATEKEAALLCELRLQLAACQDAYRRYEAALDGEKTDEPEALFVNFRAKVATLKQATDARVSRKSLGRYQ